MKASLRNGTILEGTPEEIADAMRRLDGHIGRNEASSSASQSQLAGFFWREDQAQALWNCLDGDQKKVVRFLLERQRASLTQLKSHLGKEKGYGVAGVLANISRNARRETDYKKAKVVLKSRGEDGKKYYYIAPEIVGMLKKLA